MYLYNMKIIVRQHVSGLLTNYFKVEGIFIRNHHYSERYSTIGFVDLSDYSLV